MMKLPFPMKKFPLTLLLAVAGTPHAADWGAWAEGSGLRPSQFISNILLSVTHSTSPPPTQLPSQGPLPPQSPVVDTRLRDGTRLVSLTTGQSFDPVTGTLTGNLGGSGGSGGGNGGGAGGGGGAANASPGLAVHDIYDRTINTFLNTGISELDGVSPASGNPTGLVTDYGITLDLAAGSSRSQAGSDAASGLNWGAFDSHTQTGSVPSAYTTAPHAALALYAYGPPVTAMPTSGTFSYSLLGSAVRDNVNPTAAGTLNSASLSVNFTNATANFALSASAGGATFSVSQNGVQIGTLDINTGNFGTPVTSGSWSAYGAPAVCSSGCSGGTTVASNVIGRLTGTAASGAIIAFSIDATNGSGVVTQGVSGVAALKR